MKTKTTTQKTKLMSNTDVYRDREPTRTDNSVWEIGATQTPQKEVIYVRYVFTLEQHRPHKKR